MTIIDYLSDESERTVQGIVFTEVANRQFGIDHDGGSYIVFAYCEIACNNRNSIISAQVTLNGIEGALDEFKAADSGKYHAFAPMRLVNLNIGTYILALKMKSSNATDIITVRRIRVFVMKH